MHDCEIHKSFRIILLKKSRFFNLGNDRRGFKSRTYPSFVVTLSLWYLVTSSFKDLKWRRSHAVAWSLTAFCHQPGLFVSCIFNILCLSFLLWEMVIVIVLSRTWRNHILTDFKTISQYWLVLFISIFIIIIIVIKFTFMLSFSIYKGFTSFTPFDLNQMELSLIIFMIPF